MLRFLAANSNEATLRFDVFFLMESDGTPEPVKIKAMCHTGALRRGIGNTSIDFALLYADAKKRKIMVLGK